MGIPTPNHRPTRPFAGAGAGLLLSQFPLRPIPNAALEGKGSFETIGFKRRFLPTFPATGKSMPPEANKKLLLGKVGRRRPFPTRENHPLERKRKPARRERIPTTSLRTGLGMTGLAYERIFSSPIKSTLPCTVSLRGNRRSAACGGYSEVVSRKCPDFHATTWLEIG